VKRTAARPPNLLFVFADQMRGMDMACAGNRQVLTPNLDRLAAEGVICDRHYCNVPLCGPNRAIMLSGTYCPTNRVLFNDTPIRTDLPTLGTLAKAQGYRTGYIGKLHLASGGRNCFVPPGPARLGFDDFWAVRNCGHNYFATEFHRDTPEVIRLPGYEPEVQTTLAGEFLDRFATQPDPWCLVVSWGPPHNPYEEVPQAYRDLYDEKSIEFRPNCQPIPPACLDPAWSHRPTTRDYYAQITSLDDMLGRLLRRLDELGVADDTLVVFTSDHGEMLWSHGLLYKSVPYEESISIPLVLRYPRRLEAGRRFAGLIGSVDLLPTLAGVAGWPVPPSCEGLNLAPALLNVPGAPTADAITLACYNRYEFRPEFPVPEWRGLRTPQYTFSVTTDGKPWLVFDNDRDPYQLENLADSPAMQPVFAQLSAELRRRLTAMGDPFVDQVGMRRHFGITSSAE